MIRILMITHGRYSGALGDAGGSLAASKARLDGYVCIVCIYVCIYLYIYTHIHTYIHTYINTYISIYTQSNCIILYYII